MRYVRIFLLQFQNVFQYRSRAFVWFLVTLFNPLLMLLFWSGAFKSQQKIANWSFDSVTSYYLLLIIASVMFMSQTEDDVAKFDIRYGELVKYLVKPFSYFWSKFFEEIPYRITQGVYGIIGFTLIFIFLGPLIKLNIRPENIIFLLFIPVLAFLIAFTFKMIIGILAFWLLDIQGIYQIIYVFIFIFAGYIMPIDLFPSLLKNIADILPFSYIIYYPVVAFEGRLDTQALMSVIIRQGIWLLILVFVYKTLWRKGIKKFSGVGQ